VATPDESLELLKVDQATQTLKVSRAKFYQPMDARELEYVQVGRCRRIPRSALQAFIERNTVKK
jgi:excisionase family DNA binding protein